LDHHGTRVNIQNDTSALAAAKQQNQT